MFRMVHHTVWAFDAEWTPDPQAGRLLYDLPAGCSDREVVEKMWAENGANAENPTPYLKTALCRFLSISAVTRKVSRERADVRLNLVTVPRDATDPVQCTEKHILTSFLEAAGKHRPQLVGYNSQSADLKAMIQRAVIRGISAKGFCERPEKPWQGADYFARYSDWHVDLKEIFSGFGVASPSLHQMAVPAGIPGKMDVSGQSVPGLWLDGHLADIVAYNEFDALTTYLLWLRTAHFAGFFDDAGLAAEEELVRALIAREVAAGKSHLQRFQEEWDRLRTASA
ncbi:MAG: 3'-5' exonuclease [Magnetococcus sp. WYHC-3]